VNESDLINERSGYVDASLSPATRRAYASDWRHFASWCRLNDRASLPASSETVALYVTDQAVKLHRGTLRRRLTSVSRMHQGAGHPSPTLTQLVRDTMRGVERSHSPVSHRKAPLLTHDVRALVDTLDDERLVDVRDRALLLICFAGALRRSETAALDVEDIADASEGLMVRTRRSITDREGEGTVLLLPHGSDPATCPVRAYRAWLNRSGIAEGAVFRRFHKNGRRMFPDRISGRAVAAVVKRTAEAAGYDPDHYAGHSLRRGFVVTAMTAGAAEHAAMLHSRHQSVAIFRQSFRGLIPLGDASAAARLGL
jgi:site-specific recombinase XerD